MKRIATAVPALAIAASALVAAADEDWPSYNRTLTSIRYSSLDGINAANVKALKVLCTFDTGERTGFQTGLIKVNGLLYGTTESDTFALDPSTCIQQWRVYENYTPASPLRVNRGLAYLDGRVFRGTQDGRVLAYDAATGRNKWETRIADPLRGETVPAAPIAWDGLVFVGNAGGDNKGVKGRMYALDARNGRIVWEFYMVPRDPADAKAKGWGNDPDVPITGGATWTSYTLDPETGLLYVPGGNPAPDFDKSLRPGENLYTGSVVVLDAKTGKYRMHYPVTPADFHDWDVSTAPALLTTKAGKHLLAIAPKDGYLRGFDVESGHLLFSTPVTRIEDANEEFSDRPVRFCPGSQGGSEWNGAAYDPLHNLLYTGAIEWCTTVKLRPSHATRSIDMYLPWTGNTYINPKRIFGKNDPPSAWAGWIYAIDADSGAPVWKFKAPHPILSGVTPTAGGLLFVGDMGGTLYAFEAAKGRVLWSQKIGGAIGGGVITYAHDGAQRIAVATGMTSPIWPTEKTTAKVVVLGLAGASGARAARSCCGTP